MPTYTQSGTGAKLTKDQIQSGTFAPNTFFIESGTGNQLTRDQVLSTQQPPAPTPQQTAAPQYSFNGAAVIPTPPITSPAPAPSGVTAPVLPAPNAPAVQSAYFTSATAQADQARSSLEDTYKAQLDDLNAKITDANAKIADYQSKQQDTITNDIEPLLAPFREQLETSQEAALHVNENFEANQKLTDELDDLLTQGNTLIAQQQSFGGVSFVRDARVQQTMQDISARAGVIQAVMAARNSQISVAENMIDRSVSAMTADRQDQLNYYQTLLNFYASAKDDENKQLVSLTSDQKDYLSKQISLLQTDLNTAQSNADYIKKAMIDPDTAQAYGQAGVTLNDSPARISQKLSDYGYATEVRDSSTKMAHDGYTYLIPGQTVPAGTQTVTTTDSRGVTKTYYKAASNNTTAKTQAERTTAAASQFSAAFVPGATLANGDPVIDGNGYVTPEAWKAAIADAPAEGLSRSDFIKEFGYLLYAPGGKADPGYGLTPTEQKIVSGSTQ